MGKRGISVGKHFHSDTMLDRHNIVNRQQEYFREFLCELPHPLSREEEVATIILAQQGDQKSIDKIVTHNLRFVVSVAQYIVSSTTHTLSAPYLVSEGIEGLYKALEKFRIEDGNKFISYAVWPIRSAMQEANAKWASQLRVNGDTLKTVDNIKRLKNKHFVLTGEPLSDDSILDITGITKSALLSTMFLTDRYGVKSMDAPLSEEEDADSLAAIFPSNDINPDELLIKKEKYKNLYKRISQLPKHHQYVMIHTLGLYDQESVSHDELAAKMGCEKKEIVRLKRESYAMLERLAQNKSITKSNKPIKALKPQKLEYKPKPRKLYGKAALQGKPTADDIELTPKEIEKLITPDIPKEEIYHIEQENFIVLASKGSAEHTHVFSSQVFLENIVHKYISLNKPIRTIQTLVNDAWEQAQSAYSHCENIEDFFLSAQLFIDTYIEDYLQRVKHEIKNYEENSTNAVVGELGGEVPSFIFTSLLNRKFIGVDIPQVTEKQVASMQEEVFKTLIDTNGY